MIIFFIVAPQEGELQAHRNQVFLLLAKKRIKEL